MNKGNIHAAVKKYTPPVVFNLFKRSKLYPHIKKLFKGSVPLSWKMIAGGPLKGREIYLSDTEAWKSVIEGEYDDFFIHYLENLNIKGKVIFDIGAHIGFNSLIFAEMAGPNGKVVAFEPNLYNRQRFEQILDKNQDLKKRTIVSDVAISDQVGESEFVFTDNIEGGTSSGSFLEKADTHLEKDLYEREIGFKRTKVKTVTLDALKEETGIEEIPYLIKIDIEGAEYLAMEGGKKFISQYKPILLIEIHSIFNMLRVGETLTALNYETKLLKEEKDGRCFIAATAK